MFASIGVSPRDATPLFWRRPPNAALAFRAYLCGSLKSQITGPRLVVIVGKQCMQLKPNEGGRTKVNSLEQKLFSRFGPLIGGGDLYSALGFKSYSAFYRSKELGELGVRVFQISGRRGWFALTEDVANWLGEHAGREKGGAMNT
jgi:hypothetical protein